MDKYELLLDSISSELPVIEGNIEELTGYTGLYRNGKVYVNKRTKLNEKVVVLAEEYGHHKTSVGNIIDYRSPGAWKEECMARRYAIEKIVSLDDLLSCALNDCQIKYECVDFLEVTPEFIQEALNHFFNKYGISHFHRKYKFTFDSEFVAVEQIRNLG